MQRLATQGPSTPLRSGRDDTLYGANLWDNRLVALEPCQKRLQFRRQRTLEGNKFFGAGMVEFQGGCMQEVSGEREWFAGFFIANLRAFRRKCFDLARRSVQDIADHRMALRREVYADLVRSSGIDFQLQQSEFAEGRVDSLADLIVGDRFASAGAEGGHAYAAHTVAADAGVDGSTFRLHGAVH